MLGSHEGRRPRPFISTVAAMTPEERIAGLEDSVIRLSRIMELRLGPYASDLNAGVVGEGEQIHRWAKSVEDHWAGN